MLTLPTPLDAAVLGLDAAWTSGQPSGVALVGRRAGQWHCIGVAPSYAQFKGLADGVPVDWQRAPIGSEASASDLVDAATRMGRRPPDIVAVDMPLSHRAITGRRQSDDMISRDWGSLHASTHTANAGRPGAVGERLLRAFEAEGYKLVTMPQVRQERAIVETYPHPIAIALCDRRKRVPYKASKVRKYWPDLDPPQRRQRLREEWRALDAALRARIGGIALETAGIWAASRPVELKRWEDAIDALLCTIAGIALIEGDAEPFGDCHAAIWLPVECRRHREKLRQ